MVTRLHYIGQIANGAEEFLLPCMQHLSLYSVLQKSVAKSRPLENAIDSRMRIKTITYSDVRQKPCQFYWHGLLHITIANSAIPQRFFADSTKGDILSILKR
jgi:hypothetical protein